MSYILEALKKAESERQLGSPPGLHAAPVHTAPPVASQQARMALWLGAGVLAAGALLLVWMKWPAPVVAPASAPTSVAASAPTSDPASAPTSVAASAPTSAPTSAPAPVAAPAKRQTRAAPESPLFAPAPVQPIPPIPAAPSKPEPAPPVAAAPQAPAPAPAPVAKPAPEETYPFLRDLPEPVARELPQVAIGGYIYSKNPAERLLLVDKVLRHEGEEVAPGLVLERLLPKSAVFNHRGFRYRVAY